MDATASAEIAAPRELIWNIIKPAHNAGLIDPNVLRAFQVPGTPNGIGEMQCFISRIDGREYVQMVQVIEEIPNQLAVTRNVGGEDESAKASYWLSDAPTGTRLEMKYTFTVPGRKKNFWPEYRQAHWNAADRFVRRVKTVAEDAHRDSLHRPN